MNPRYKLTCSYWSWTDELAARERAKQAWLKKLSHRRF